jgi:hypothetical protein
MAYTGLLQSYKNTEVNKVMVTDRILQTNPLKIVPYARLGTDVGKFAFVNMDGKEYRWLEDTFIPEASTLAALGGAATTTDTTAITMTNNTFCQAGDLIKIDDEVMWVSAVSGANLTVTRNRGGGALPVTHVSASVVSRVGRARIDGDDADDSPQTEVTSSTNFTQILQRSINVARTKQKMAQYGISDPMGYEIDKKMDELMMQLCKIPYHGYRAVGAAGVARAAGGFRQFITTNSTDVSSAALTRDHIDDLLQVIHAAGGDPDLILCGSFAQRKINSFYEGFIETERSEAMGGNLISVLQNPISGSSLEVLVDLHCPVDELWILESDKIAYYPFDPFFFEDLAKTGDAMLGEVVGEYGFVVAANKHHGFLEGISVVS